MNCPFSNTQNYNLEKNKLSGNISEEFHTFPSRNNSFSWFVESNNNKSTIQGHKVRKHPGSHLYGRVKE